MTACDKWNVEISYEGIDWLEDCYDIKLNRLKK